MLFRRTYETYRTINGQQYSFPELTHDPATLDRRYMMNTIIPHIKFLQENNITNHVNITNIMISPNYRFLSKDLQNLILFAENYIVEQKQFIPKTKKRQLTKSNSEVKNIII